jgi:LssY C-terminus
MKSVSLLAGGVVLLAGVFAEPAVSAQFQIATAGKDYSFTISTAQPWTDTGVDLHAGDVLEIHATSAESCDPAGVSGGASTGPPVVSAPPGALIARLQAQGVPVLIGSGKQLTASEPGHLFLGVNASDAPPCSGRFAVKVHIAVAALPTSPVAGNSLTATSPSAASPSANSPSTTSQPAASSTGAQKSAVAPDVKSKLASAAQVFLSGQFGGAATTSTTSSSAIAPTGSDVVAPTSTTSASASTPVALKVSSAKLDAALQKNIDSLPRRVNDRFDNQGDMVNFVLVGSEQQVKDALDAAGWRIADTDNK